MQSANNEEDPTILKCVEYIDMNGLWRLMNTDDLDKTNLLALLDNIDHINNGVGIVYYDWQRSPRTPSCGRFYATGSLISQSKLCRAYLGTGYVELDLVASNPALLFNLMAANNIHMVCLDRYLRNRDEIHQLLYDITPDALWDMYTTDEHRYTPKLFINSVMMGSMEIWRNLREHLPANVDGDYFRNLVKEFVIALDYVHECYIQYPINEDAYNQKASRLASVLMTMEALVVKSMIEELFNNQIIGIDNGYYQCGYAYDGILVQTNQPHRAARILNNRLQQMRLVHCRVKMKELTIPDNSPVVNTWEETVRVPDLQRYHANDKLLIRYPTGTGKTYSSIKYSLNNYNKILIIVHRQQLAHDIKKNYPQFRSYLGSSDDQKCYNADLQIICLNSLGKLTEPDKYECIIADEISSLLSQLVEMRMPSLSKEMFRVFLTKPDLKFIGMDALICDEDITFLKELVNDRVEVVSPNYLKLPDKTCELYKDIDSLKQDIIQQVSKGKRVCIAYSIGLSKMNGFLTTLNIPVINVNRFTKQNYTIEDFRSKQVVAFSPTMDAGVDVSFFDDVTGERFEYFDIVYGLFDVNNTRPKQAVQMLGRVRDCNCFKAAFTGAYRETVFNTKEEFNLFLRQRSNVIERFGLDVFVTNEFRVRFIENFSYRVTWNLIKNRKKRTTSFYKRYFLYYLMLNSWKITFYQPDDFDHDLGKQILEAEKEGVLESTKQVASARVISEDVAKQLLNEDLDIDQYRELLAFKVNRSFGLDKSREPPPVALDNVFGDHEQMRALHQYIDYLQEKQMIDLYPYDDQGKLIEGRVDYIKKYRSSATMFYRTKTLIDLYNDDQVFCFEYVLHKESMREIVSKVRILLENIGFTSLDKQLRRKPKETMITKAITGKLDLDDYLEEKCGLVVKEFDTGYRLCSLYCCDDYEKVGAYFIENSPLLYTNHEPRQCPTCFKMVIKMNRHVCPDPGEGFEFIKVGNKRSRLCTYCDLIVERNAKRHRERCAE